MTVLHYLIYHNVSASPVKELKAWKLETSQQTADEHAYVVLVFCLSALGVRFPATVEVGLEHRCLGQTSHHALRQRLVFCGLSACLSNLVHSRSAVVQ